MANQFMRVERDGRELDLPLKDDGFISISTTIQANKMLCIAQAEAEHYDQYLQCHPGLNSHRPCTPNSLIFVCTVAWAFHLIDRH